MTFGVALGSALTTLVGGVLFAAVGDMIGWDVLGKGLAVAVGAVAVALALVRMFPAASPAVGDDEDEDARPPD
jgi:predicted MFS family arabinose efflux permease